jgi:hypothetical protein
MRCKQCKSELSLGKVRVKSERLASEDLARHYQKATDERYLRRKYALSGRMTSIAAKPTNTEGPRNCTSSAV